MRLTRITTAAASVLLLAGCGAAATTVTAEPPHGTVSGPVTVFPANPVTVLKLTGATPDKGEVYGTQGLENNQVAHGTFPGGESVFVFTYDTAEHRTYWVAHPMSGPQDGETEILGPSISLIIVDAASLTSAGGPTPAQIAVKVGGTVLPR